jgi:hypothetical protein
VSENAEPWKKIEFVSSTRDPGRALPLAREEHAGLVSALRTNVIPLLELTATRFLADGWYSVNVRSYGSLAGLYVECINPPIQARLRFQVHESFASLVRRDPVFWMFIVYNGSDMVEAKPGRLPGADDAAGLAKIAEDFVKACRTARSGLNSRIAAYFEDMITLALDGENLQPPSPSGNLVTLEWGEPDLIRAIVLPMLELAGKCLEKRFPVWRVKVDRPGGDNDRCRLALKSITRETVLSFSKYRDAGGEAVICYEVMSDGRRSPMETIEIIADDGFYFTPAIALESVVGEFLFSVVFMAAASEC